MSNKDENRMCDLCSSIENYNSYRGGSYTEDIFYNSRTEKYMMVLEQARYETATLEIKYCPECGRKLENEVK